MVRTDARKGRESPVGCYGLRQSAVSHMTTTTSHRRHSDDRKGRDRTRQAPFRASRLTSGFLDLRSRVL